MTTPDTPSAPKPGTRKVFIGTVSGAVATIIASLLSQNGITLSEEAFGAISTAAMAIFAYVTRETYT